MALTMLVLNKKVLTNIASHAGKLFSLTGVIIIIILEHRLPLFGSFESVLYISFILSIFESFPEKELSASREKSISMHLYIMILIILLFQINKPMKFNHDFFMYGNIWVNIFFNLRLTAAAFFIYAAILFCNGAWNSSSNSRAEKDYLMRKGRNLLLTGVTIYLASEWAGSIWCLDWLGDSWRWSKGFFKASIVFLLVMTSLHLPPFLRHPFFKHGETTKAIFGSLPGIFMLWMIFHH